MAKKEIVVIGVSRFSTILINRLNNFPGYSIVAIDKDQAKLERLTGVKSQIVGDATKEEFLKNIGIENSDFYVIATGSNFEDSLVIASILKDGIYNGNIIVLSVSERQEKILREIGIKNIVNPEETAAKRVFNRIINPLLNSNNGEEIIEVGNGISLIRVPVVGKFLNKKISELKFPPGIAITLIYKKGVPKIVNGETLLTSDDIMTIIGLEENIVKFISNEIEPEVIEEN